MNPSLGDSVYGAVAAVFVVAMNNDTNRALELMDRVYWMVDSVDRQRIEGILGRALHGGGHPQGFANLYEWLRRPREKDG